MKKLLLVLAVLVSFEVQAEVNCTYIAAGLKTISDVDYSNLDEFKSYQLREVLRNELGTENAEIAFELWRNIPDTTLSNASMDDLIDACNATNN